MIDKIIPILEEANKILMDYFKKDFSIEIKKDQSPVSEADIAAHTYITTELKKKFNYPILSEEDPIDYGTRKNWNEFWLLDPLDGTKEFINGIGQFSICLSFMKNNIPTIGFISNPAENKIYVAEKGKGISVHKNGQCVSLDTPSGSIKKIALVSRFHNTEATINFLKKNKIDKTEEMGSALKFISLAKKTANIYPRLQGSKEWDIAAGHVFLMESGIEIFDLVTLAPPLYNKQNLQNNHFIAYDPNIYDFEEMVEYLK